MIFCLKVGGLFFFAELPGGFCAQVIFQVCLSLFVLFKWLLNL